MLVSHRFGFIYTKTVKTAGTSVEAFFEPYCVPGDNEWSLSHYRDELITDAGIVGYRGEQGPRKTWYNHMPAHDIKERLGEHTWSSYYKFCVIRNPYEKAVSWYNHARRFKVDCLKTKLKNLATSKSTQLLKLDFQRWVNTISSDRDKYTIDGVICMDDFIFFERLEEDTKRICNHLNLPVQSVELPRLKTGVRVEKYDTTDYYNSTSRQVIEETFRPEIEAFGYSFPSDGVSSGPDLSGSHKIRWPKTPPH